MSFYFSDEEGFKIWFDLAEAQKDAMSVLGLFPDEDDETIVADALLKYPNLEYLNLSDTLLSKIPNSLFELEKLRILIIDTGDPYGESKYLRELPDDIAMLTSLERLELNGQKELSYLPAGIVKLTNLRKLVLNSTGIKTLPGSFERLQNLNDLQMRWMLELEFLPESFCDLKALTILDLLQSKITALPPDFYKLQSLHRLNLNFNRNLQGFPGQVIHMKQLETLLMREINISQIPAELVNLQKLTWLDMSSNPLGSFPLVATDLPALEKLAAENCLIKKLPERINRLTNLKELSLAYNHITSIDAGIHLPQLEKLDLRGNPLEEPGNIRDRFNGVNVII